MVTFLSFFAKTRNILHQVYVYKPLIYSCIGGSGEGEGNILKIVTRARGCIVILPRCSVFRLERGKDISS